MKIPLHYPRLLCVCLGGGVSRCGWENKVLRGPGSMHSHIWKDEELMKWQLSSLSRATNEPLWREGTAKRFREKPTALFPNMLSGEMEAFPIYIFTRFAA